MPRPSTRVSLPALIATAMFVVAGPLFAQAGYPGKAMRIIPPVQPGGGIDLVARTMPIGSDARSGSPSSWKTRAAAAGWSAVPPRAPRRTATR